MESLRIDASMAGQDANRVFRHVHGVRLEQSTVLAHELIRVVQIVKRFLDHPSSQVDVVNRAREAHEFRLTEVPTAIWSPRYSRHMPVGDCEREFADAAASDGIVLDRASERWLNQRGHLGLPDKLGITRELLESIFVALGGDLTAQDAKRMTPLPGDFIHRDTGTLIEVDEPQHFTSFRLLTFDHYPQGAPLGFDLEHYRELCETWSPQSDKYRKTKAAVGFGPGGRQRQRAYHDALRDLATPAMGRPPLIRVDATDRSGVTAYRRSRDRLHDALG